ncbi:glycosyltransferase [Gordonia soli]|uniref:Putative glycosyltransferase n=1 Tax=Gordonia soli NBRC 108243 TaxID=1223545 RepID=M0QFW0_9ACTN|nr:glycosyltransferase [Gordonia soli]GAC67500.1 putative glycosyltransferase [Gordonia soli NBRC 108243]
MANILIAAYGSRGDIMPLTDIACGLIASGHHVTMTTNTELVDELTVLGIDARPVDFKLDQGAGPATDDPMKLAMQMVKPKGMRQLSRNLLAAVADVPADVVLLTPFAELAGHPLAEARGIPSAGLRLQPMSATYNFPPTLLGAWNAGSVINRSTGRSAARWFDRFYGKTLASLRADLDLPSRSARSLRRERTANNWPILHGFSPSVVPRPDDWRASLEVVGYWWPRNTPGWTPPADLERFLVAGPPPVYVGFGSLMLPPDDAAQLAETVRQALESARVRGIVQSGGTSLEPAAADNIFTVGPLPHDWLFPRVSAVVHSCGAGTTAAGLRAGVPTIAVPSPGGDQPFWARRLTALGASPATITRSKLTASRLAAAITATLDGGQYRTRAQDISTAIANDDGATAAIATITNILETARA